MSTEENKAILEKLIRLQESGDLNTVDKVIAPNWVNHDPSMPPLQGSAHHHAVPGAMDGDELRSDRVPARLAPDLQRHDRDRPGVFSFQFDATVDGTIVSLEAMLPLYLPAGVLGLAEAVVENIVKRQLQHDLLTLKDVLEGGAVWVIF